jgi:hypothetical protein
VSPKENLELGAKLTTQVSIQMSTYKELGLLLCTRGDFKGIFLTKIPVEKGNSVDAKHFFAYVNKLLRKYLTSVKKFVINFITKYSKL